MNHVQISQTTATTARLVIDGNDISEAARSVTVQVGAGDVPDVTVHAHAWPDIDLTYARVRIVVDANFDTVRKMLATSHVYAVALQAMDEGASLDRLLSVIALAMNGGRS